MPLAGPSSTAATLASGNRASAAVQLQRETRHSVGADSATMARCDDSRGSDGLLTNAKHDVHYFDVLHPILLSHVRRANSDGVLALLSLPSIAESDVFWRTCTYREGLVAAVLIYVMEHTGQLTVPARLVTLSTPTATAASPPGVLVTSNGPADDSPVCSPESTSQTRRQPSLPSPWPRYSPALVVPSDPVTATDDGLSPTSHSFPITSLAVDDLHALLHLCSREGAEAPALDEGHQSVPSPQEHMYEGSAERPFILDRRHPPALATLLRVGKELRQQRRSSTASTRDAGAFSLQRRLTGALRQEAVDMDLELYIQSVMRRLEAMRGVPKQAEEHNLDGPGVITRKRPRWSDAPAAASVGTSSEGKGSGILTSSDPDPLRDPCGEDIVAVPTNAVDLAALAAVLQEHCHGMVYVNPFNDHPAASAAVVESTDSTAPTATTAIGISSSTSNGSRTNPVHAAGITTTGHTTAEAAAAKTSIADLVDAAPEPVSEGAESANKVVIQDSDAQDVPGGLDAVALLRRIPAISATRWVLPSDERNTTSGTGETGSGARDPLLAPSATATGRRGGAGQRHPTGADAPASADSLPLLKPLPSSPTHTAAVERQTNATEEQARVSAAIRAFDVFTAALEQSAGPTAGTSAGSLQSTCAPTAPFSSLSTGNLSSRRTAARLVTPGAIHSRPPGPRLPPPPRSSSTSEVRRRYKFSPQEDAAILHGVARYGQMSGSFQYILHAYRSVWRAGRTALHLYDHWRGALRRRAVAAASEEVPSHTDTNALNEALHDEDEAMRMSPIHPATPDNQDLSSDIEDFSDAS
ncbi:conserved hypothetical protein [Leishmania braziliensis MHOM/BR/75/M2904]|uniref:Ttaggg binding factor n=2 Tax=Leishmania braziliensis TaxID=5660 RepID=A4H9N4_LEIBR|nr:conserved hypothetical protein [Leishmania braziliensis MHOM/BR/75/M2904]CAJ2470448.1 unnamed protein product [Leishmania braziliensis]CAM38108.1 conserved hypothetical protein [Leishmania braziliensis MHOM/BR/75/M2904]SYZ64766.1 ttaggg_binding_factor [Leishmania braziliensis MHOM/BR/75/M2904]